MASVTTFSVNICRKAPSRSDGLPRPIATCPDRPTGELSGGDSRGQRAPHLREQLLQRLNVHIGVSSPWYYNYSVFQLPLQLQFI